MHLLRNECATLEHHCTETTNDILKEIIEDIVNLEKDLRKLQAADHNEIQFLKQQASGLTLEKTRLQQVAVELDNRISTIEGEVGFE